MDDKSFWDYRELLHQNLSREVDPQHPRRLALGIEAGRAWDRLLTRPANSVIFLVKNVAVRLCFQ